MDKEARQAHGHNRELKPTTVRNMLSINTIKVTRQVTDLVVIDNSVVTCRHITINSSTSAPLNAKKIAVKKGSDVDVVMFGQEL